MNELGRDAVNKGVNESWTVITIALHFYYSITQCFSVHFSIAMLLGFSSTISTKFAYMCLRADSDRLSHPVDALLKVRTTSSDDKTVIKHLQYYRH